MPKARRYTRELLIRIDATTWDNIAILASAQDLTSSDIVRRAIRVYLRAREQSEGVNVLWDTLLEEERELS